MTRYAKRTDANHTDVVTWKCGFCGEPAKDNLAHTTRRKYCSTKCMGKAQSIRHKGSGNPNFKLSGYKLCLTCGDGFTSYTERKFCSVTCYAQSRRTLEAKNCKFCNISFMPKTSSQIFCGRDCNYKSKPLVGYIKKGRKPRSKTSCRTCGVEFNYSKSTKRIYCSYECHLKSGGAIRAGQASIKARMKYGQKKDANHNQIFSIIQAIAPVKDLSSFGCGVPDGVAWISNAWHFFDVKNPKTAYGKRGLNQVQQKWANDWRGGAVYLIYTDEEATQFANGNFQNIKKFPEDRTI